MTRSHFILRTPEKQPKIQTPNQICRNRVTISAELLFSLRCGQRNGGKNKNAKVLLCSDTLAHLTIQSLIEQVFFRRALRFKKVKKLA